MSEINVTVQTRPINIGVTNTPNVLITAATVGSPGAPGPAGPAGPSGQDGRAGVSSVNNLSGSFSLTGLGSVIVYTGINLIYISE